MKIKQVFSFRIRECRRLSETSTSPRGGNMESLDDNSLGSNGERPHKTEREELGKRKKRRAPILNA